MRKTALLRAFFSIYNRSGTIMKTTKIFVSVISSILLAFFLIAFALFAYNYYHGFIFSVYFIYNLFLAQLIVFSVVACLILIFVAMPLYDKMRGATNEISKIVLLSEMNVPVDEYTLFGRTYMLIGRSETSYISLGTDRVANEYAVINRVKNYWYIERVSDERNVGLKRAGEQYVYKLKPGLCYKLQINDTIYVENERLLVI